MPFTRRLSLKAVIAGGGEIHRLGLSDTIMLFDEHRIFLEEPANLKALIVKVKERSPERAVMVEVVSEADAFLAAEAMADVIQLENSCPLPWRSSDRNPKEKRWPSNYRCSWRSYRAKCRGLREGRG